MNPERRSFLRLVAAAPLGLAALSIPLRRTCASTANPEVTPLPIAGELRIPCVNGRGEFVFRAFDHRYTAQVENLNAGSLYHFGSDHLYHLTIFRDGMLKISYVVDTDQYQVLGLDPMFPAGRYKGGGCDEVSGRTTYMYYFDPSPGAVEDGLPDSVPWNIARYEDGKFGLVRDGWVTAPKDQPFTVLDDVTLEPFRMYGPVKFRERTHPVTDLMRLDNLTEISRSLVDTSQAIRL